MKSVYALLLICLLGSAAAQGYTSSQNTFLMGEEAVKSSMDQFPFEDYVETYYSSYIGNPENVPAGPVQTGPAVNVSKTMSLWMISFPFDVPSSSFGDEASPKASGPATDNYEFVTDSSWTYTSPFLGNVSSLKTTGSGTLPADPVEKNSQMLEREVKGDFGI